MGNYYRLLFIDIDNIHIDFYVDMEMKDGIKMSTDNLFMTGMPRNVNDVISLMTSKTMESTIVFSEA